MTAEVRATPEPAPDVAAVSGGSAAAAATPATLHVAMEASLSGRPAVRYN